jgi:hypothetical protein
MSDDKGIGARLTEARKAAGYGSAADAARALGVKYPTYAGHENGSRGLRGSLEKYARKFGVSVDWLLTGKGDGPGKVPRPPGASPVYVPLDQFESEERPHDDVRLVGYVGAGQEAHYYALADDELDRVPAPDGRTADTVAVEIRGSSLGALFDRWLVYYDDVRTPVSSDQIGALCVVGLPNDKVLIKKLRRSKFGDGLFDLLSNTEDPILGQPVMWAAKVKSMVPR